MKQNDDMGEVVPAQGAFGRFEAKIKELSDRRNGVFVDILGRIDKRKLDEVRQRMESSQEGDK